MKIIKEILGWVISIALAIIFSYLFITFIAQKTNVIGESMENTLKDKDQLIINKLAYRIDEPQRFDIVVFPYHKDKKTNYIKRIIGMPGETVQIKEGYVYINGELLEENYGKEVMEYYGRAENPIVLGEDEYFVLGDNRNNSSDSRFEDVGNIKRSEFIGKTTFRVYPFDTFGKIKNGNK